MSDLANEVTSTTQEEKVSQSGQQAHDEERPQSPQPAPSESENFDVTDEYDVAASLSGSLAEHALNLNDDPQANIEEEITSLSKEIESKPVAAARAGAILDKEDEEPTEEVKPIDSSTETESNLKLIETLDLDSDEPKIIDDPKDEDDKNDAGLQVANIGAEQEDEEDDDVSQIWKFRSFDLILTFFFHSKHSGHWRRNNGWKVNRIDGNVSRRYSQRSLFAYKQKRQFGQKQLLVVSNLGVGVLFF